MKKKEEHDLLKQVSSALGLVGYADLVGISLIMRKDKETEQWIYYISNVSALEKTKDPIYLSEYPNTVPPDYCP